MPGTRRPRCRAPHTARARQPCCFRAAVFKHPSAGRFCVNRGDLFKNIFKSYNIDPSQTVYFPFSTQFKGAELSHRFLPAIFSLTLVV